MESSNNACALADVVRDVVYSFFGNEGNNVEELLRNPFFFGTKLFDKEDGCNFRCPSCVPYKRRVSSFSSFIEKDPNISFL